MTCRRVGPAPAPCSKLTAQCVGIITHTDRYCTPTPPLRELTDGKLICNCEQWSMLGLLKLWHALAKVSSRRGTRNLDTFQKHATVLIKWIKLFACHMHTTFYPKLMSKNIIPSPCPLPGLLYLLGSPVWLQASISIEVSPTLMHGSKSCQWHHIFWLVRRTQILKVAVPHPLKEVFWWSLIAGILAMAVHTPATEESEVVSIWSCLCHFLPGPHYSSCASWWVCMPHHWGQLMHITPQVSDDASTRLHSNRVHHD